MTDSQLGYTFASIVTAIGVSCAVFCVFMLDLLGVI
jgi:hypothetical protein